MKNCLKFLFISLIIFSTFSSYSQNVELTIKGIRSSKGTLLLGVFKDEESFKEEKPFRQIRIAKKDVKKGVLVTQIYLEEGTYGLSLLDDENRNNEMDYNFLRMPEEGFGFSNYYHTGFTRPKLENFHFRIFKGKPKKIEIKIRYL